MASVAGYVAVVGGNSHADLTLNLIISKGQSFYLVVSYFAAPSSSTSLTDSTGDTLTLVQQVTAVGDVNLIMYKDDFATPGLHAITLHTTLGTPTGFFMAAFVVGNTQNVAGSTTLSSASGGPTSASSTTSSGSGTTDKRLTIAAVTIQRFDTTTPIPSITGFAAGHLARTVAYNDSGSIYAYSITIGWTNPLPVANSTKQADLAGGSCTLCSATATIGTGTHGSPLYAGGGSTGASGGGGVESEEYFYSPFVVPRDKELALKGYADALGDIYTLLKKEDACA